MSIIKKFIDKVALAETRQSRELIIPITEAKELRDEIAKLLVDKKENKDETITVVMNGGKW
jgi:hypothetical protein